MSKFDCSRLSSLLLNNIPDEVVADNVLLGQDPEEYYYHKLLQEFGELRPVRRYDLGSFWLADSRVFLLVDSPRFDFGHLTEDDLQCLDETSFDGEYYFFDSFAEPTVTSEYWLQVTDRLIGETLTRALYHFVQFEFISQTLQLCFELFHFESRRVFYRKWRAWLGGETSLLFTCSLFTTVFYEIRLSISGAGYYSEIIDDKNILLIMGLSHDILVTLPHNVFCGFLDNKKTSFSFWSHDRSKLVSYGQLFCQYRPIDQYQLCGLRFAYQHVFKKQGKKKYAK